jgi:glycosyltransferase involved in cell wall biosynthesis
MSTVHPPNDIRVFERECASLARHGYGVTLVLPHTHDETRKGVRIRAVAPPRMRLDRILRTTVQVCQTALREDADLYHFHDSELIPIGLFLKLLGRRVVYDAHEDITAAIANKAYIPKALRAPLAHIVDALERASARLFDGVVAATPKIATRFPHPNVVIVQNFPAEGELTPAVAPRPYEQREAIVAYVGHVSRIRGVSEMLDGIHRLSPDLQARLVIAGEFRPPALLEDMRRQPGADRASFLGWQSRDQVALILSQARVGLLLFHPVPNHIEAQPNKLFEYMAAGLPIIASDFPLWREQIEGIRCGIVVDPLDAVQLADALRWLLEHPGEARQMGERGRAAASTKYAWDGQFRKLLQLYEHITKCSTRR